jgi:hypothetical protein
MQSAQLRRLRVTQLAGRSRSVLCFGPTEQARRRVGVSESQRCAPGRMWSGATPLKRDVVTYQYPVHLRLLDETSHPHLLCGEFGAPRDSRAGTGT